MPIYEYTCRKGHHFEKMQSFSAKPIIVCPECGAKSERVISLSAFHLKGSGWYSKDSKSSKKKTETKTTSDEKKTDKAKEKKTEAKAETKTESKTDQKK